MAYRTCGTKHRSHRERKTAGVQNTSRHYWLVPGSKYIYSTVQYSAARHSTTQPNPTQPGTIHPNLTHSNPRPKSNPSQPNPTQHRNTRKRTERGMGLIPHLAMLGWSNFFIISISFRRNSYCSCVSTHFISIVCFPTAKQEPNIKKTRGKSANPAQTRTRARSR